MDSEKLNLRDLPAVEPIELYLGGLRMSQTLAHRLDVCPRSGYLYAKYSGGPGSHPMDRGTLVHYFGERMALDLLKMGERNLYEAQLHQVEGTELLVPEDEERAQKAVASLTSAMIDELLEEHPELHVSSFETDQARVMAYHMAIGWDVDPATILGVERKFVLDLECGVTLSGKIDLCALPGAGWLAVDDYKTAHPRKDETGYALDAGEAYAVPTEGEFDEERSFQLKLYALLVKFGVPVEDRPCPVCESDPEVGVPELVADGVAIVHPCERCRGRGKVEVRLPGVGDAIRYVRARQIYPRAKPIDRGDGVMTLVTRERSYTIQELVDFRHDVERIGRRWLERVGPRGSWKFPAIPSREGGYCNECAAPQDCPLPARLRRWAGAINSHEQAVEAYAWVRTQAQRVSATDKEVKAWARSNGPLVQVGEGGRATVFGFEVRAKSTRFRQKGGKSRLPDLIAAAQHVAEYGGKLELGEYVLTGGTENKWQELKWTPERVASRLEEVRGGESGRQDVGGDGSDPGVDPPVA